MPRPPPAAHGPLTLTIVETNSSTSTATWRTMIPSNRRSILAASCARRSSCLPGKTAEAGREAGPTGASERGRRSARREGPRAGGMQGAGTAPARPRAWPGQAPGACTPPGGRPREGSSRPQHPRPAAAGPACDRPSFALGTKQGVRTSKSPPEERFLQKDERRPRHTSTHPGLPPSPASRGEGGRRGRVCPFPYGGGDGGVRG